MKSPGVSLKSPANVVLADILAGIDLPVPTEKFRGCF
jgi:hypothetical protein